MIKPVKNIGASKNVILKHAMENDYDYCFIIEDDMIIKDDTVFDKYMKLIQTLDYNVLFYGFDNKNRVLANIKPNPCINVIIDDNTGLCVNRSSCSSFMLFKVEKDMLLFNDNMIIFETDELLWRMKQNDKLQSYGFYPDIKESWLNFDKTGEKRARSIDQKDAENDMVIMKEKYPVDMDADGYINFIRDKFKEETK